MATEDYTSSNPFEGLLTSQEARNTLREIYEREYIYCNGVFQRIFLTTIESDDIVPATNHVVKLTQLTDDMQSPQLRCLSTENMEQALLERLQMAQPQQYMFSKKGRDAHVLYSLQQAMERSAIRYLAFCYARATLEMGDAKRVALANWCKKLIVNYAVICISTSEMFSIANLESEFVIAFHSAFVDDATQVPVEFFSQIIAQLDDDFLQRLFFPVFQQLYHAMGDPNFLLHSNQTFTIVKTVEFLTSQPCLALLLVRMPFWFPPQPVAGRSFEVASFMGRLMSISCCPANPLQRPMVFDNAVQLSKESVSIISSNLQGKMQSYIDLLTKIVRGLLKADQLTKLKMIEWIVECCNHNVNRTKMSEYIDPVASMVTNLGNTASDRLFINLSWVMSRLTAPFCGVNNSQLKKIDPFYCLHNPSHDDEKCGGRLVAFNDHIKMSKPPEFEGDSSDMMEAASLPFHFTTHCFYITHHCLTVGLIPVLRRYERLAQEVQKFQHHLQNLQGLQGVHMSNNPVVQRSLQSASVLLNLLYSLKTLLTHSQFMNAVMVVYGGTAEWLAHLVLDSSDTQLTVAEKEFPITDTVLLKIQHIPETLVSGLASFAQFSKKFYYNEVSFNNKDCAYQFVNFLSLFLGSSKLISNPHLRAELVELLSLITPQEDSIHKCHASISELFCSHKIASDLLIRALLQVFVDVENSGGNESDISFRFDYRLPIYDVLKHLWPLPEYKKSIKVLCEESDTGREPPVFLRFLHFLVNDSTLLLDVAFENLAKVRQIELEKASGSWNDLSAQDKQDKEEKLRKASNLAKTTNLLARKTIHTLTFLTESTPEPFITSTMVDKLASTLNYYLAQLVGPKQKELKVAEFEKYNFRPDLLVSDIVTVYINLSFNQSFCDAVPRDGRSYSPEVFSQAEYILKIINKPAVMIMQLHQFALKVGEAASKLKTVETTMGDIPEEFLDPILGTVMNDPVTLPNSQVTLDRTSIVRHLLSDATDPFTRDPLTMDQVVPNVELKERIEAWRNNLPSNN